MKRGLFPFIVIVVSVLCSCNSQSTDNDEPASKPAQPIIFFNGSILTMEDDNPQVEAIAVQDQKILAVGSNEEILALQTPETLLVDLNGRTLMPGFVDAHTHLLNDARPNEMSLDEAQWMALRNGITTLGDLFVDRSFLKEIQNFDQAGLLHVRASLYLVYNDPCGDVFGKWYKSHPPTRLPGEMLRINGIKIFTDGGSCGHPALSFELRKEEGLGDLWMTQAELNQVVKDAQSDNYQVAIHAIGDRAVEQAQNAIAYALDGKPNTYRHRMEHISVLQPDMITRFGEIGIIPVIPGEYPSCSPFGPPLPKEYGNWEWPWGKLREENPDLNIAWHTDYPFASISPFVHLYGFVTRNDVYRNYTCPARSWLRDDTLSVEQALSIMTIQSAYALFREDEVGSLKPRKYADLIVLTENPLTVDPAALPKITVVTSMVGGRFEYCQPDQLDLCPGYVVREPVPLPDIRPPVFVRWLMLMLVPALPLLFWRLQKAGKNTIQRFGWAAGIAGGLCWIAALWFDLETSPGAGWLILLAVLLLSTFIANILVRLNLDRFMRASLTLAGLGFVSMGEGFILSAWFQNDLGWPLWMLGLLVQSPGLLLFGIANLKRRVLPRWNFAPLILGGSGLGSLLLGITQLSSSDLPLRAFVISISCGWILMGISDRKAG
jgi:predicted amidohydrolase YtcJ